MAQQIHSFSNLRTKKISTKTDWVKIDSLSIIPSSLVIPGVSEKSYELDWLNGKLKWETSLSLDSVSVTYRVFPFKLNAASFRMKYDDVKYNFMTRPIEMYPEEIDNRSVFEIGRAHV